MKRTTIGAALLVAATIGCSDSTSPATAADLTGTWNATSFVFTNTANTTESVDVIPLGVAFTITFTETTMSGSFTFPGEAIETFEGTFTITGDQITISDPIDGDETWTHSLTGSVLTLTATDTFDFNDDGQETPATMVITMTKQ